MNLNEKEVKRLVRIVSTNFVLWTGKHLYECTSKKLEQSYVDMFNDVFYEADIKNFVLPYKGEYPKMLSMNTKTSKVIFGITECKLVVDMNEEGPIDVFKKWNEFVKTSKNKSIRGFKWIKDFPETIFELPKRSTSKSAGYDIYVIHPKVFEFLENSLVKTPDINAVWKVIVEANDQTVKCNKNGVIILPTGLKAYMQDDEFLMMAVRSSSGIKNGVQQANPPSVIDADYFENKDNDGHIYFAIRNKEIKFDKPIMRIAQGIFMKYLVADNDDVKGVRVGGIGSTGDK